MPLCMESEPTATAAVRLAFTVSLRLTFVLNTLTHLIVTTTLCGSCRYFTDEETEAQRGWNVSKSANPGQGSKPELQPRCTSSPSRSGAALTERGRSQDPGRG